MVGRCGPLPGPRFSRFAFSGFGVWATGQRAIPFPVVDTGRIADFSYDIAGSDGWPPRLAPSAGAPPEAVMRAAGVWRGRCAGPSLRGLRPVPCTGMIAPAWPDSIFQSSGFSWAKVACGPCGPHPPSYMRLTVAVARVFYRWGFGLVRRQGPANLPQKEGYEDHGKGHWDRSRHHEFVRRRNGWQGSESH